MRALDVPEVVRTAASTHAAGRDWLRHIDALVMGIARDWSLTLGDVFSGGTASLVVEATTAEGGAAVLKVAAPDDEDPDGSGFGREIRALQLAAGRGCVRLLAADLDRRAALLERLGPPLVDLGLPVDDQLRAIAATVRQMWVPVDDDAGLTRGDDKGRSLAAFIARAWEELDQPCSARVIDRALQLAERRVAAFDRSRAVLLHGDAHQWNTLADGSGRFRLVDPDGLWGEPEYDLAIPLREISGPPGWGRERCRVLAALTDTDETAIWEWGFVERVSTGLLCARHQMQPMAATMLAVAEAWCDA